MRIDNQSGVIAVFLFLLVASGLGCEARMGGESGATRISEGTVNLAPRGVVQRAELREEDGVVDGDTLRAVGFGQSIRLLCLDSEERLDGEDLQAASADWNAYSRQKNDESERPGNYGTFLGNEASAFAREFFEGHSEIFIEYKSPRQTRGFYGRHLGYVWVREGEEGEWRNYNIEAVRAGMSPYVTSYGWCDRYHDELVAAQEEARQAGRGIWDDNARGYGDYEERLEMWSRRARQIGLFRTHFEGQTNTVELGTDTAMSSLRLKVGQRAVVFGELDRHAPRATPPKLYLSHRHREELTVVAEDGLSFERYDIEFESGQFYYVEGEVEMYRGNPQLRVDMKSFVRSGDSPPPIRNR